MKRAFISSSHFHNRVTNISFHFQEALLCLWEDLCSQSHDLIRLCLSPSQTKQGHTAIYAIFALPLPAGDSLRRPTTLTPAFVFRQLVGEYFLESILSFLRGKEKG